MSAPACLRTTKCSRRRAPRSCISARRTVTQTGGVIDEHFELNLPERVIAPQEYDAFVAHVRQVDDGFLFTTRAELRGK